jgi:3-hydroxyisobutyrate dehydrogenase-like beta-hydroxyacid dehydrogenase
MLGFVGLGYMGARVAGRLLEAGYPIGVYNRTREKTQAVAARGAHVYESPQELARAAEVVLSMLADDAAVEQVMLGANGIVAAARPGTTIIDLSSVHPDTSRSLARAASTPQAEEGSLVVFVGGDSAVYEQCRPILDVIGNQVFYLGPNGSGATMKLVANSLLGAGMQALAEALVLGQRGGLDREVLVDVLEQTAVLAPGLKRKLENARAQQYPVQFPARLMWKDLGNVLRLAEERAVPMPVTGAAQQA